MKKFCKNLTVLFICVAITLIANGTLVSYAYLLAPVKSSDSGDYSASVTEFVEEIYNEIDLYKYSLDSYYNNADKISRVNLRKTLKMMDNIALSGNIVVTADVHLDLNGKTVSLNGNKLFIRHNYAGSFLLYNGIVTGNSPSTDKIIIDTPYASIVIPDGTVDANVTVERSVNDADYVFNGAFLMINNALENYNSAHSNLFNPYVDSAAITLGVHRNCYFQGGAHICASLHRDADLPFRFYGYKVGFEYVSDYAEVFSPKGKVNPIINSETLVTLTAKITFNGAVREKTYLLHIIDPSSSELMAKAAISDMNAYLEPYYVETDLDGDSVIDKVYALVSSVLMPTKYAGLNGSFVYSTINGAGDIIDSTAALTGNNFTEAGTGAFVLTATDNAKKLRISHTSMISASPLELNISGDEIASIKDKYTIANAIVKSFYPEGRIKIFDNMADGADGYNNYSKIKLEEDVTPYQKDGVSKIEYALINNSDNTYSVGKASSDTFTSLHVVASTQDKLPTIIQTVFLKIVFSFEGDPEPVTVSVPIVFEPKSTGGDDNVGKFLPYYGYFDRLFSIETGGYSFNDFEMPFTYNSNGPVFYYEIEGGVEGLITQTLQYTDNFGSHSLSRAEVETLDSNQIKTIASTFRPTWKISVDKSLIAFEDTVLNFKYRYKFGPEFNTRFYGDGDGVVNSDYYVSSMTVPGIVRCDNSDNGMPDPKLYEWVYNTYRLNKSDDAAIDETLKYQLNSDGTPNNIQFILTDWLNAEVNELDNADNKLGVTKGYKGLQYLNGLKRLNLSNAGVNINNDIDFISGCKSLIYLNLASNNLYDRAMANTAFPTGTDNRFLQKLALLPLLEELHLENNKIYQFADLTRLPSLKTVYTYNNSFTATIAIVGGIFTNIVNGIYGSQGTLNQTVYAQLLNKKVSIYHIEGQPPFSQASGTISVYDQLKNIEYQDKLPVGVDVSEVYNYLSTDPRAYGIVNKSDSAIFGSQYADEMKFSKLSDNIFICTYTYYVRPAITKTAVNIEVEYEVSRF